MSIRAVVVWLAVMVSGVAPRADELRWQAPTAESMKNLGEMLGPMREKLDLPALAAAVVQGDRIIAGGAVGLRKIGKANAVTLEDKFHIGSITKSMTALLAVMMEKEGKIELDATAGSVLPEWKMPEAVKEITLRMLLQNRGGLATQAPKGPWAKAWKDHGEPQRQRERFLKAVLADPLEEEPNTRYIYSNQGFALAGAMLEKAAGKPWEELAREGIFKPLGLEGAGFHAPDVDGNLEQPWGHTRKGEEIKPIPPTDNPPAIAPAGGVHASILDMARYAAFHMELAAGNIPELKEYVDDLYTPPEGQDYALGWVALKRDWGGGTVLTHNGSNTMNFMVVWVAPVKGYAIVVATNIGDESAREKCDEVVGALITQFID